jgi:hypothetical protein
VQLIAFAAWLLNTSLIIFLDRENPFEYDISPSKYDFMTCSVTKEVATIFRYLTNILNNLNIKGESVSSDVQS